MKDIITIASPKWCYEAKEYEHKTGMKGIAADYIFPQDMLPYQAFCHFSALMRNKDKQTCMSDQFGSAAQTVNPAALEFVNDLIALNPALSNIRFNAHDPTQIHDLVAGVASKFNVDDIDFFINEWTQMYEQGTSKKYLEYQMALAVATGFYTYFIGSPNTFEKIKDYFSLSEWEPTEDNLANLDWKFRRLLNNELMLYEQPEVREVALSEYHRRLLAEENNLGPFQIEYKGRNVKVYPYEQESPSMS